MLYETLSGPAALAMEGRVQDIEWQDGDVDGERTLDGDAGQVAITIYIDREPAFWSATIIPLDAAVGGLSFTRSGEALSISSAKIDAAMEVPGLIDKAVRFLIGELELD